LSTVKEQTAGFKGSKYKKFTSQEDAQSFVEREQEEQERAKKKAAEKAAEEEQARKETTATLSNSLGGKSTVR
jgi:viroplasmin and RNaseH domain-containing protein